MTPIEITKNEVKKEKFTKCSRTKVKKLSIKNFAKKDQHIYNNCFKLHSRAIKNNLIAFISTKF